MERLEDSLPTTAYSRPEPVPNRRFSIFLDESCTNGDRYMAIGGVWVTPQCEAALRSQVARIREECGMRPTGEFKWVKLSSSKVHPAYPKLVDAFFSAGECRFNAIVVDRLDPGFNRGVDGELDYYKSMHWLVRRRIERDAAYRLFVDRRTNQRKDRLTELRDVLNNAARLETRIARDFVKEVAARDSRDDCLIQLADVLVGAVCFHMNAKHQRDGASAAKCGMAEAIARRAGFLRGVLGPTPRHATKVNIWRWQSDGPFSVSPS
jgi:hypothetical protein